MISDLSTRISSNVGFTDELIDFKPELKTVEETESYGKFEITGLERGWGTTLGNGLRRVLLGALPGTAITSAQINATAGDKSVVHEYSTVPHMRESVGELLINVRGIRIRSKSETSQRVLTLNVEGECEVKAGDIMAHQAYEIVNPELHLATLDSTEAKLTMRFDVERGEGYRAFDPDADSQIGRLPVDAIFTPVLKANYVVQNLSGRMSGREGLTIEVWTDRTVPPTDALQTAGRIFRSQLEIVTREQEESDSTSSPVTPGLEHTEIRDLEGTLSTRVINSLVRHGIGTLGDLRGHSPDNLKRDVRNFGDKSFNELRDFMILQGLWAEDD